MKFSHLTATAFSIKPYTLQFSFDARTSRGLLKAHPVFFIKNENTGAIGEVAPLSGLSPEYQNVHGTIPDIHTWSKLFDEAPSIRFGMEQAMQTPIKAAMQVYADTPFTRGEVGIDINGLVWMADLNQMYLEAKQKIKSGFSTIKFKIGSYDFDSEFELLKKIRKEYPSESLNIRLDANGAYTFEKALYILDKLTPLHIHSIEQPIAKGNTEAMQKLCGQTPIPIALDEELIGIHSTQQKQALLNYIKPQYLILKPTLIGGIQQANEWIKLALERNIGWWATSALESSIGLNHIAQWVSTLQITIPQGLGTGTIYTNNIDSPLEVRKGKLWFNPSKKWNINLWNHTV